MLLDNGWLVIYGTSKIVKPGDFVMRGGDNDAYMPPGVCMVTRTHGAPGAGLYLYLLDPSSGCIDKHYISPGKTCLILRRAP